MSFESASVPPFKVRHLSRHESTTMSFYTQDFIEVRRRQDWVKAASEWVGDRKAAGWIPNLVTFKFLPLDGTFMATIDKMRRQIERLYRKMAPRAARRPRSIRGRQILPILLAAPDLPVYKRQKDTTLVDTMPNDGLHCHSIIMISPRCRFGTDLKGHIGQNERLYIDQESRIHQIHVVPLTHSLERATQYAFKTSTLR